VPYHAKQLYGRTWDAVVLQLVGQDVSRVVTDMWGHDLGGPKDVLAISAQRPTWGAPFLRLNLEGCVFLY